MKKLTDEEMKLLQEGTDAKEALQNPAIASAINSLSEALANSILNTKPEDSAKREMLFNVHLALRELVAILNQRVNVKENLESQMVEEEND